MAVNVPVLGSVHTRDNKNSARGRACIRLCRAFTEGRLGARFIGCHPVGEDE